MHCIAFFAVTDNPVIIHCQSVLCASVMCCYQCYGSYFSIILIFTLETSRPKSQFPIWAAILRSARTALISRFNRRQAVLRNVSKLFADYSTTRSETYKLLFAIKYISFPQCFRNSYILIHVPTPKESSLVWKHTELQLHTRCAWALTSTQWWHNAITEENVSNTQ